ncbi:hypothetical protein JD844_018257 [Phrynosoma platyrhinos]|uniref:Uncharacterized protein n=1 Tax=Phrynosoma platyrhinos TaxID=52577 RepID=A0ABQ7SNA4_PHRPL|nr:hypothetical protein JD844_018257 [Phrynosoma platyrhinos]
MQLSWSFTSKDKKLIVDLHNQYRSKVSPPAADMLKMVVAAGGFLEDMAGHVQFISCRGYKADLFCLGFATDPGKSAPKEQFGIANSL